MIKRYNPSEIEPKWQKFWEDSKIYQATEDPKKPKRYVLEYFPYPSGAAMHVGHVRNYTIGDVMARFNRMRGYNVLHPMGWDGFGLPAENYAIKNNVSPRVAIDQNTLRFKKQLMQMGFSYDWSREIDSTDPKYYKWTQWFFIMLLKKGLAYQQESLQWWCPTDKTVLANEQVEDGCCWRCGSKVEKKALKQWFFKITDYAERLLNDLEGLDWSESIKSMQRNWIGKSQGVEIDFSVEGIKDKLKVFTTRPDTIFGATFIVLAPDHPSVKIVSKESNSNKVEEYIKRTESESDIQRQETDREKTGVFTGSYVTNPLSGSKMPIWISDYVLSGYGTGAIMGVPAHDNRDLEFAKKFNLPIINVINPEVIREDAKDKTEFVPKRKIVAVVENDQGQILTIDWGPEMGGLLTVGGTMEEGETPEQTALREIAEETGYSDIEILEVGQETFRYKYYAFSKQVAVDAQTKFIHARLKSDSRNKQKLEDNEKGMFKVAWTSKEEAIRDISDPLHRHGIEKFILHQAFGGEGIMTNSLGYDGLESSQARDKIVADLVNKKVAKEVTNYRMRDWLISRQRYWGAPIPIIHCPKDGPVAVPDDQLPVKLPELDSFTPSGDGHSPLALDQDFVNTTCPKCHGPAKRETDTMDGFACSSWYFLRFTDPANDKKPFDKTKADFWLPVDDYIGGAEHAVMHLLYARFWTKVMKDEGLIDFDEPFTSLRNHGMILAPNGLKMSKSKNNTIEPDELIKQGYGADSIRIMELFIGPWNQMANWSVEGMGGSYRFLNRVWTLTQEFIGQTKAGSGKESLELKRLINKTIDKVSKDLVDLGFNTVVATLMECVNELYKIKTEDEFSSADWKWSLEILLKLLAPLAPHISEELWSQLGHKDSVHSADWPIADSKYLVVENVTIVIQVNGKLRSTITARVGATKDEVQALALKDQKVTKHLGAKQPTKVIFVKDKLINLLG